ncbi:MAG: glycoside hydrolase family 31 protein [Fibrobacteres bacterium]|nr:glycoside hydrolase family 31 protein [Fibrobacterota bacterium]
MKTLGSVSKIFKDKNSCNLLLENGRAEISAPYKNAVRIRLTTGSTFETYRSYAIENYPEKAENILVKNVKDTYTVKTDGLQLKINAKSFSFDLLDSDNTLLSKGAPLEFDAESMTDIRIPFKAEDYFGLGERITPLGRRGYKSINWNIDCARHHNETQESMYISIPFMISLNPDSGKAFGYFLDVSYKTEFDLGNTDWNVSRIKSYCQEITLFLFTGSLSEIVETYTRLTGRHAMPPIWALGYNQCRWSYMSTAEAADIARTFRKKKIPCDVLWYDIDYMDNFRVFTFDKERFADIKSHCESLKKEGFRHVVIVDPGVKVDEKGIYQVLDEANNADYFMKHANGKEYVGKVWPGGTKFPDFSRKEVREWWGALHKVYHDAGIDGFWNDMNEIADFTDPTTKTVPADLLMYDDGRWSNQNRMHNVYGLLEAKATIEGMRKLKPNDRPFLLTRAAYCGIQKYSAKWYGDNTSTWNHLKESIQQTINMGLSGIGFAGADVGGFTHNPTPELLARWTQLGAFYPFFRNHTAKNQIQQEPWAFGSEIESICRDAINLRYHLLPYFYQLFRQMHETGHPIFRSLFWDGEISCTTMNITDQFMIGSSLLVAPVVERGARTRKVYFPKGKWYSYFTGEMFMGESEYVIDAPLTSIPLFIKENSIIPVSDKIQSTNELNKKVLIVECTPGEAPVQLSYYEDDLLTNDYEKGKFIKSKIIYNKNKFEFTPGKGSEIGLIKFRILSTLVNGRKLNGFVKQGIWLEKELAVNGKKLSFMHE